MPEAAKVIVCIPTFRRPRSLARLLAALEKIETGAAVRVLVADNDAEKQDGFHLSRTLKSGYRWPLDAISVPERGIAQVRNALLIHALDKSDADFIAMLDDDEWPEPQWLKELLRVQAATGADVLSGSVLFDAPGLTKGWAGSFDGLAEIRRPTGLIAMLEGAGNMLIERRAVENLARPFFDAAFALTGGEDRDFFMRLRRQGAHFAWADKAIAITSVPQTRASLSWALKRAYSIGNNDMRLMLKHEPGLAMLLRETAKIAGVLLLSPVLLLILGPIPNRRTEPSRKLFRNAGKLMALFGVRYNQYAVIHGE